jgi:hypothetical protein
VYIPAPMQEERGIDMYTVDVYADDIVIETEVFNTLGEAFKYANKYCVEYYTEINNVPYYLD